MQRLENGKRCNYRRPPRLHRTAILDNRLFLGGCGYLRTFVLGGVRGDRGSGGVVERKEKRMTGYKVFLSKEKKYIETVANIFGSYVPDDMSVQHGELIADDRVPKIYHDEGYYYCAITYEGVSEPFHEIIFG